jgi:hypothetical protein
VTTRPVPTGAALRMASVTLAAALALLCPFRAILGWGHEGHVVGALIAGHYKTPTVLTRAGESPGGRHHRLRGELGR